MLPWLDIPRAAFRPDKLPGLAAWYSADVGVLTSVGPDVAATEGQTVRRWLDRSGNGRHLDQATLANQPTLSGGGVSVSAGNAWIGTNAMGLGMSGVRGVIMSVTPFSHASNRYFMVAKNGSLISESTIGQRGTVGSGQVDLFAGSAWSPTTAILPTGSPSVIDALFGGSGASRINVTGTDITASPGVSLINNEFYLFATGSGGGQSFARINEVIFGITDWSLADRTKIRQYLTRKWG